MHQWGVFELRDLGNIEKISTNGEGFATTIHDLHEEVKMHIDLEN